MDDRKQGVSRRDLLRGGSFAAAGAAAGLLWGFPLFPQTRRSAPGCIDIHAHLWTDEYLDLVASYGKTDTGVQRNRGAGTTAADIEKRFALMESAGVDQQVLSVTPQSPHFENKAHAVNAARKANDMYADAVRRWPRKFAAFGSLPLPHVDESLEEMDRALGSLGMMGVATTTDILGRSIADPAFLPIYEELNRRHSVLFVHPAGTGGYSPLISKYDIIWMIGAPVEDTIADLHLITRGIPSRFPNMKIITAHLGGAMPMILERLDSVAKWEDPQMTEKPSVAARRMWYDTVNYGDVPALQLSVKTLGADRLVLGSDFPYETGDMYVRCVQYIREAGLSSADVSRILDGNSAALLGYS